MKTFETRQDSKNKQLLREAITNRRANKQKLKIKIEKALKID